MIKRVGVPLLLTLALLLLTIAVWRELRNHEVEQIARIAEAESYAARSRLIRDNDTMLRALREAQKYWSRYGRLPAEQWASDAGIELSHFVGLDLIIWSDPSYSVRYLRTASNPVLNYRPTDDEWSFFQELLAKTDGAVDDRILGPFVDDNGKKSYEIYVAASDPDEGALIAVVDAEKELDHLLTDDSPGYAIAVNWNDVTLYERDTPAANLPNSWVREGLIKNSMGAVWTVRHAPTFELAKALTTSATTIVLIAGGAVSLLLGLLTFENTRANRRAAAALIAEEEVFLLNRDLEIQIAERTQELQERSSDLVTIADSVAHDLRNPLNSVSVHAQLLEQQFATELGSDGISILRKVSRSVQSMAEILDRLLGLSVVSNVTFSRDRLNMRVLVSELFDELVATEPGPSVELILRDVPDAYADPNLVPTLLMNVLGNAMKYSRSKSERRIEVSSETSSQDDGVVYVVKDNGIGFEPELVGRLFKAFERLGANNDIDGLGLGLDIAARIVSRHKGRIWAKGIPGDGAIFYFTLGTASVVS